jgi:peptidyl-prolyl cis-trans isomerase-like 4
MSCLFETSLGEFVVDFNHVAADRFLNLCKIKHFNYQCFTVQKDYCCQINHGSEYFVPQEFTLKHTPYSFSLSTVWKQGSPITSYSFFINLSNTHLVDLDDKQLCIGHVVEGFDVLEKINKALCEDTIPFFNIRIKQTIVLDNPADDPLLVIPHDDDIPIVDNGRFEIDQVPTDYHVDSSKREADARALTLEMIGDLPFAEIKPPENILFVCKLNPITRDQDLELIFSRFGNITSCQIVRDKKTGTSMGYAFIEFENVKDCEEAYAKMENVLIDDRRIHVDFSQSVSKLHGDFMSIFT